MLPAVAYTLADFINSGIPSISTESIRFEHPSFASAHYPSLNLYLYDISRSSHSRNSHSQSSYGPPTPIKRAVAWSAWFNASFLLTVQEHTQYGRQRIITAAMAHCQQHAYLSHHQLAPTLRGYGCLPLQVQPMAAAVCDRLDIPQQPGLQLTLTVPFDAIRSAIPITA